MKKACVIVSLLSLFLAQGLFAAGEQEAGGDNAPIEIRVQTRWASEAPHEKAFQDLLAQFDQERDDIVIVDESIGDEQAFNDKLKTSIATGNTPDLVYTLGGESFKEYAQNGIYADLAPEFEKDPEWRDFFLPLFDNWTFDSIDGVYGIPYEFFGVAIFYNKAIFQEQGLEPPATIAEFEAVADKLLDAGIIPMAMGERGVWRGGHLYTNLMMKRFGFDKVKALAERDAEYTDADVVEVFALMDRWNRKGYLGEDITGFDYNEEKALFHNGESAMHMDGSWYISSASETDILDSMGVIPFPYFADYPEHKNAWMGGSSGGLSISGSLEGEKYQAVVDLLKFLTSPDAYAYIRKEVGGGVYPVKLEPDPDAVNQLTLEYSDVLSQAEDMKTDSYSYDPLPQMTDRVRNSIQGLFVGSLSPQETAEEIQNEIKMSE